MPDEEDYSPSDDTEEDEAASPEEQSPASELEADIPSDAPAADDTASAVAEADFDTDDTAWAADDSTDWRAEDDEYNFAGSDGADATADVDFDPADTAEADPLFFDDTAVDPSAFDGGSEATDADFDYLPGIDDAPAPTALDDPDTLPLDITDTDDQSDGEAFASDALFARDGEPLAIDNPDAESLPFDDSADGLPGSEDVPSYALDVTDDQQTPLSTDENPAADEDDNPLSELFTSATEAVSDLLALGGADSKQQSEPSANAQPDDSGSALGALGEGLSNIWEGLSDFGEAALGAVSNPAALPEQAENFLAGTFGDLGETFTNLFGNSDSDEEAQANPDPDGAAQANADPDNPDNNNPQTDVNADDGSQPNANPSAADTNAQSGTNTNPQAPPNAAQPLTAEQLQQQQLQQLSQARAELANYRQQVDAQFNKIVNEDGTVLDRAADTGKAVLENTVNTVADVAGDAWNFLTGNGDKDEDHKLMQEDSSSAVEAQTKQKLDQLDSKFNELETAIKNGDNTAIQRLNSELYGDPQQQAAAAAAQQNPSGEQTPPPPPPGLMAQTINDVNGSVQKFSQDFNAGGEMLKMGLVTVAAVGVTVATGGAGAGAGVAMLAAAGTGAAANVAINAADETASGHQYSLEQMGNDALSGLQTGALSAIPIPGVGAVGGAASKGILGATEQVLGREIAESAIAQGASKFIGHQVVEGTYQNAVGGMLNTAAGVAFDPNLSLEQKLSAVGNSGLEAFDPSNIVLNTATGVGIEASLNRLGRARVEVPAGEVPPAPELPEGSPLRNAQGEVPLPTVEVPQLPESGQTPFEPSVVEREPVAVGAERSSKPDAAPTPIEEPASGQSNERRRSEESETAASPETEGGSNGDGNGNGDGDEPPRNRNEEEGSGNEEGNEEGQNNPEEEEPSNDNSNDDASESLPEDEDNQTAAEDRNVTVYRVEGEGNQRVLIDKNGGVDIPVVRSKKGKGPERALFLNFGDEARAEEFLQQRSKQFPDTQVKSFDVPEPFLEEMRRIAVPQSEKKQFPNRPEIADPTKASDQFGLTEEQIKTLREVIIQGTGKIRSE
ncbi:hypothetical protein [Gloeobacter kilaueensis]|uniref:Transcription termination factor Rho n=1 Tax=Gloeobacter kilaueensis (strain ATCC BAA-2537 / CCAP 1431/1 / ULC 316 / JS1) TaxID=1183438 RepID=U5QC13_GLOK1|nr:hypothetical protein [Gloeobacter kilaueensis]AGY56353.1 transcription termination factor Rho [Gloeobacter kilaueensis JS1]